MSQEDEAVIIQELTRVSRGIYGTSMPEPSSILFENWRSNRNFLGTYSNVRTGAPDTVFSELANPEGRLYLAGEGTTSMNGYVHGAYLSGINTVNAILGVESAACKPAFDSLLILMVIAMCKMCNL